MLHGGSEAQLGARVGVASIGVSARVRVGLVTAACALLYCVPTLLNGAPFFYVDSATYLAQGQEALEAFAPWLVPTGAEAMPTAADAPPVVSEAGVMAEGADAPVVVSGRSIYYGVLAYLGVAHGGGAGLVALQAAALAWPLTLLCRALFPFAWAEAALGASAATALLTPAGVFAGLVTPDIWLAAMALALAAYLVASPPGRRARAALAAIVALGALFHTSHLLVLCLGLGVLVAAALLRRPGPFAARRTGALMAGCAVVAILGQILFGAVIERRYGTEPISRPHLTARLTGAGPGLVTIEALCAAPMDAAPRDAALRDAGPAAQAAPFAVCAYRDRLPLVWTRFLFDPNPDTGVFRIADPATKRRLSDEDLRFAAQTFRHAPVQTAWVLASDVGRQLVTDDVARVPVTAASVSRRPMTLAAFPPGLAGRIEASRAFDRPGVFVRLDRASDLAFAACGLALAWVLATRALGRGTPVPRPALIVALTLLLAIALNAAVCGALASPYGRFGARVAWLFVPAAACLVLPTLRRPADAKVRP